MFQTDLLNDCGSKVCPAKVQPYDNFQVAAAPFTRNPADPLRESRAEPPMGCRFMTSIGMATHPPVLLHMSSRALTFSARLRFPRRPCCDGRPCVSAPCVP